MRAHAIDMWLLLMLVSGRHAKHETEVRPERA